MSESCHNSCGESKITKLHFNMKNGKEYLSYFFQLCGLQGWLFLLEYDGEDDPAASQAKSEKEEKDTTTSDSHSLSSKSGTKMLANPAALARQKKMQTVQRALASPYSRPYYDAEGQLETKECVKLRSACWNYIKSTVPAPVLLGIRARDVFDFVFKLTESYTTRRGVEKRHEWMLHYARFIRVHEMAESYFARLSQGNTALAEDGCTLSEADKRSALLEGIAYHIHFKPGDTLLFDCTPSPYLPAVSTLRSEEEMRGVSYDLTTIRQRLINFEKDHLPHRGRAHNSSSAHMIEIPPAVPDHFPARISHCFAHHLFGNCGKSPCPHSHAPISESELIALREFRASLPRWKHPNKRSFSISSPAA